jgi:hypothetical protein
MFNVVAHESNPLTCLVKISRFCKKSITILLNPLATKGIEKVLQVRSLSWQQNKRFGKFKKIPYLC